MKARRVYYTRGPKDCPLAAGASRNLPAVDTFVIIHWHTQFQLSFVEKGSAELFSPNGNVILHEGDICIVPPEEVHGIRAVVDGTAIHEVVFSPELITVPEGHFFHTGFVKPLREGLLRFPRMVRPDDPGYEDIKAHLLKLLSCDRNDPNFKPNAFLEAIGLCLALMPLSHIAQPGDPTPLSGVRGNDAINICTIYIGRNYSKELTLQELADLVHLHPNYLCRLFKQYCGQTVFEYITSIRISFASQFIRKYDKPLQQIAEECGFNSMSYFNKKFKAYFGLTPYAYSKLYKNR